MSNHVELREGTPRRSTSSALRKGVATALALVTATTALATPGVAHAEDVKPTAKGIVGTALLGAEVVVFAEAIFGVQSGTAYAVGAGAGAVAGGVGGYFIEQAAGNDGHVPAYLLAGGLALAIPAIVVALDATRYRPAEGAREDKPTNLPASDPGKPGGSSVVGAEPAKPAAPAPAAPAPAAPAPAPAPAPGGAGSGGTQAPLSLLNVNDAGFRVGMPIPDVRPVLGSAERKAFGVTNTGSEVRFPVVRVTF